MGTSALIAYRNDDGQTYNINTINFDGYLEGVGSKLINYYDSLEQAKKLVNSNDIRGLENSYEETEFYPKKSPFLRKRKNLTFEELCNEAGNYSYTYVYEDDLWQLLDKRNDYYMSPI